MQTPSLFVTYNPSISDAGLKSHELPPNPFNFPQPKETDSIRKESAGSVRKTLEPQKDPVREYNKTYENSYRTNVQKGHIKPWTEQKLKFPAGNTDLAYENIYNELASFGVRHTDPKFMTKEDFKALDKLPDFYLDSEEKKLPPMEKARLLQVKVYDMAADIIDTRGQRPLPVYEEESSCAERLPSLVHVPAAAHVKAAVHVPAAAQVPASRAVKEGWLARKAKAAAKKVRGWFK